MRDLPLPVRAAQTEGVDERSVARIIVRPVDVGGHAAGHHAAGFGQILRVEHDDASMARRRSRWRRGCRRQTSEQANRYPQHVIDDLWCDPPRRTISHLFWL